MNFGGGMQPTEQVAVMAAIIDSGRKAGRRKEGGRRNGQGLAKR